MFDGALIGWRAYQVAPPIRNEGFIAAMQRLGVKTSFEPLVRLHHGHGQTCQEVRSDGLASSQAADSARTIVACCNGIELHRPLLQ